MFCAKLASGLIFLNEFSLNFCFNNSIIVVNPWLIKLYYLIWFWVRPLLRGFLSTILFWIVSIQLNMFIACLTLGISLVLVASYFSFVVLVCSSTLIESISYIKTMLMAWFHCGHIFSKWCSWWNVQYCSMPNFSMFNMTLEIFIEFVGWLLLLLEAAVLLNRLNMGGLLPMMVSLELCLSFANSLDINLTRWLNLPRLDDSFSFSLLREA